MIYDRQKASWGESNNVKIFGPEENWWIESDNKVKQHDWLLRSARD